MVVPSPGSQVSTPGIGAQDFLVAQAVAPRQIRQRVFADAP